MVPLALTSTTGWIRRLGGKRWNLLHKLVYVSAGLGVVHYWWKVKLDVTNPMVYAAIVAALLGARLVRWFARRQAPSARTAPARTLGGRSRLRHVSAQRGQSLSPNVRAPGDCTQLRPDLHGIFQQLLGLARIPPSLVSGIMGLAAPCRTSSPEEGRRVSPVAAACSDRATHRPRRPE